MLRELAGGTARRERQLTAEPLPAPTPPPPPETPSAIVRSAREEHWSSRSWGDPAAGPGLLRESINGHSSDVIAGSERSHRAGSQCRHDPAIGDEHYLLRLDEEAARL